MEGNETDLWHQWQTERRSECRDRLLLHYLPWARMLARDVFLRVHMRGAEWADYVQNASVGLYQAIERFDPTRGVDFRSYARHRVRGAVFNGLRVYADLPQPRTDTFRAMSYADRARSLAEEPSDDALDDVIEATVGLGLGYLLDCESVPTSNEGTSAYGAVEQMEMADALQNLLSGLPERERLIITLHYLQQVPFVLIASQLGLTKGRVSQLHRRAIGQLRLALTMQSKLQASKY